ncbi:hypothetical protein [Nitratifractor sp.]|uniref:hypothetical protein n=1 Tax=Nitratifractor sp. TaxID=2268144 RepID=UPI0025CCD769|nr:hypothetical protein [Nitratifractor sp.]
MSLLDIPVLAMIFAVTFTVAVLFLLRYWVPRRNASLFVTVASNRPTQYGTGPTLNVGDDLKAFKEWKYREMMEKLLHLKHKIYLESELLDHHTAGGQRIQMDPSSAQQAIAMSMASEFGQLASSLKEKRKDAGVSWLKAIVWSLIGALLYTLIFGGIVSLTTQGEAMEQLRAMVPVFLTGLGLVIAVSAYFGSRSWSDYYTIQTIESELKQMKKKADPFLAFNGIQVEDLD